LEIDKGPKPIEILVTDFVIQCTTRPERRTAAEWLKPGRLAAAGPADLIAQIEDSLDDPAHQGLVSSIAESLVFCIAKAPEQPEAFERADGLPLARARREAKAWGQASTRDFVCHVLESWVLAQHVYWSVGRGLADARARGKTILRLRVALEDGGWNLTSASARLAPGANAGRLRTHSAFPKNANYLLIKIDCRPRNIKQECPHQIRVGGMARTHAVYRWEGIRYDDTPCANLFRNPQ
jgi:hypothetical protein